MTERVAFLMKDLVWYRVLRYRKGFGRLDSVRYGFGWRIADQKVLP